MELTVVIGHKASNVSKVTKSKGMKDKYKLWRRTPCAMCSATLWPMMCLPGTGNWRGYLCPILFFRTEEHFVFSMKMKTKGLIYAEMAANGWLERPWTHFAQLVLLSPLGALVNSMRTWWSFNPCQHCLKVNDLPIHRDEIEDPHNLNLSCTVNGVVKQVPSQMFNYLPRPSRSISYLRMIWKPSIDCFSSSLL